MPTRDNEPCSTVSVTLGSEHVSELLKLLDTLIESGVDAEVEVLMD